MNIKKAIIYTVAALILLTAPPTRTLGNNETVHEIPFEYSMNKILVPIKINGSNVLPCILDTGMVAGVFLMNPAAAKGLNLTYSANNVMLRGAGSGTASASLAMGAKFELASILFESQRVIVLNDSGPLAALGIDCVIGASVFNRFVVQMDMEKELLRLYPPGEFDDKDAGESFDLTITRTKPFIKAIVNVDGKKDVPITVVVDTGAGTTFMLAKEKGISVPSKSIEGVFGRGVGGKVSGKSARIEKLKLGKYELLNIITRFSDGTMPVKADGLIGMKVLERFLVTFDYPGKRMFLKPNSQYNKPFEFSMIGISIRPGKGGLLYVEDVFDNSPASDARILPGDIVVSIDKKPLTYAEYLDLVESLVTPGKKIVIEFERDGKRQIKSLELRRLL